MQIRTVLFAVSLCALSACQEDLTEQKATWETRTKAWATRVDALKKGHEALAAKVKAFALPGEATALQGDKAALDKALETGSAAIANAEKELAGAKTSMDALIAQGKKVPVEVALTTAGNTVDGVLLKAESLVSATNEQLEQLGRKVEAAKAEAGAIKSRTDAWLGEVKKKGGTLMIEDLAFNGESIDLAKSRIALTSLATSMKACAELKADLTVVALGETADLATKRADSLKAQLAADGVNATVISKTVANVVKEGEEKVSFAVTTPCK
jgi:hypothetical protein